MASIARYDPRVDPFGDLVDDIFKGFLVRPLAYEGNGRDALPRVKVDVAEKNGAYMITAELPGVKKEDIQVSIDGSQVSLAAEAKFRDGVLELTLPKKQAAARKQISIQ
jgi:HSP20 family protein